MQNFHLKWFQYAGISFVEPFQVEVLHLNLFRLSAQIQKQYDYVNESQSRSKAH